jgi:acyl carrier protein
MAASPLSELEVAQDLVGFVNTAIMARGRGISAEASFETAGVDSLALLKILLFVESRYGFWVPDEDLTEENTASALSLARYICRRRSCS